MTSPSATLADLPLLAEPEVGWAFTPGVDPYVRRFRVSAEVAKRLASLTGETALKILVPGRPRLEVRRLSILAIYPTPNPALAEVEVSDRRIWWSRIHVVRAGYNVPRATAVTRRLVQEGVPVQVQQVSQGLGFAAWSLFPRDRPTTPWTAQQVLEDVLGAVAGAWRIEGQFRRTGRVTGLAFDDSGPSALTRALSLLAGANLRLEPDGTAVVFDEHDRVGEAVLEKGVPIRGQARAQRLDLARSRPSRVRVLFDRKVEVRFDAETEGGTVARGSRTLTNVAPVPDAELTLASGQVLGPGSWARIDDLFAAWPAPAYPKLPRLSHRVVRDGWLSRTLLDLYSRPQGVKIVDPVWAQRISTVRRHYRQTYQPDLDWLDRTKAIETVRVGVLDTARQVRASSPVYADYGVLLSDLGIVRSAADGDAALAFNVYGYAAQLSGATIAAPADVSLLDPDQGILSFTYRLDATGLDAQIVPSALVDVDGGTSKLPTYDLRKAQKGRGEALLTQYCHLTDAHHLSTILTLTPGAPNDERVCHVETVDAADVAAVLGTDVGPCEGPVWTIRVGSNLLRATYEWNDTRSPGAVDAAWGLAPGATPEAPTLALGAPSNSGLVREVALAAVAALYSTLLDRVEGAHVTAWDPGIKPRGNAVQVEHRVPSRGGGVPKTFVTFPRFVRGIDVVSILPESVRQEILGGPIT